MFRSVLAIIFGVFVVHAALASQWDEQIKDWKKESLTLQAEQIPQLEDRARKGEVKAAYLLYLEAAKPRYQYAKRDSAQEVSKWAQTIANAGNPIGMRILCYLYSQGKGGVVKSDTDARSWCVRGAEAGFGNAMTELGAVNELGEIGLTKDITRAVDWYRKGAEAGDSDAMLYLGGKYELGQGGLSKDEAKAVEWYRKAAEAGSGAAMAYLGVKYEHGQGGLSKDLAKAIEWYRKGAELDDATATLYLGTKYQYGRGGLPKDQAKAVALYRKSAMAGNARAMTYLGTMYEDGLGDLVKDETKALDWYLKGTAASDGRAMARLGLFHSKGKGGLRKDELAAVEWFRKGDASGDYVATTNLGVQFRDGRGVAQDHHEAVRLFRKVAEVGASMGMLALGKMYQSGQGGLPQDYLIARQWYEKAVAIGDDPYAMTSIGELHKNGYGVTQDDSQACVWYRKAAEAGEGIAMVHLADGYRNGKGVAKDLDDASRWYAKALSSYSHASFNDTGEVASKRSRRLLDEMLAQGQITDPEVLRKVKALSKPAPSLAWLESPLSTEAEEVQLSFRIADNGGGIGDVQIKLDGAAFNPNQGRNAKLVETGERRVIAIRLPPGKHEISVLAYNAENLINFSEIKHSVTSTFKPIRKPQLHAVVVGIDQYDNDALKLRYAGNDAREMAQLLKAKGPKLFDEVQVTLLDTRINTGKAAILQAIKAVATKVQTEDVFMFYVAGHGMSDDDYGYHMLSADVRLMSDERMRENSISAEELQKAIYNVPSAKKVVLLDTCHSGKGLNADSLLGKRGMENLDMVKRMNRKSGAVVMAASESKEQALEGYQGHGLFTYALLEALGGKADTNGDGFVSTRELQDYVEVRAAELAEKLFKAKQSPYPSSVGQGFELMSVR